MSKPVPLIVALDYATLPPANHLVDKLDPKQCRLKVGKEMFTRFGPSWVKELISKGFDVFLDLKFHDIPNTVARACRAAADLGVWMLNVHALGGSAMLAAAVTALADYGKDKPLLTAVTVLTSFNDATLATIGIHNTTQAQVVLLADLAAQAKLDGVVCSALEATVLKQHFGTRLLLVTPGIRLSGDSADDQQRIMSPADAIKAGADYLVVGRSVTQAADPMKIISQIAIDISNVSM